MENIMTPGLPLLIFNVNETLLDLDALVPHFERIFGASAVMRERFAQLILYSQAITLTEDYVSFRGLGGDEVRRVGKTRGVHITATGTATLKDGLTKSQ